LLDVCGALDVVQLLLRLAPLVELGRVAKLCRESVCVRERKVRSGNQSPIKKRVGEVGEKLQ
jgi:hypothetical protein